MRHFIYRSLAELEAGARDLGTQHVRFQHDPAKVQQALLRKVPVGDRIAGNSMAIHPMEGCDGTLEGHPDELTWRRYERFARGGCKLIWFEATAVHQGGRANPRQIWLNENTYDSFARLYEMMIRSHTEVWGTTDDLLIPIQLTSSGRYSVPTRTLAYHNPLIDQKNGVPADYPVISDDELERLEDSYVETAALAQRAGFTALDLKATHGYLLAELLGAKTREGRYGGSLENRTRFLKNVLGKMRARFGDSMLLCMRLGCFDSVPFVRDEATGLGRPLPFPTPYPWGWGVNPENPLEEDLSEVKQAITWFQEWGIQLLNVSLGSPYYNPHIGRPFEKPDDGNYEQPEHPFHGVDRHFRIAGELQRTFPKLPIVGTGYSWLQKYAINAGAANVEDGNVSFLGLGRGVLSYPDFAKDVIEKGELDEIRVCKTLTYCTFLMRQKSNELGQYPAGCPPFDKLVYGPIMKEARHAKKS
ncbi:NADH:flavin oxidoreductase [Paludibaculum fermentans]|uniref:oxidoreductase n=1 Tax=Paludibaculum fermentans TaxID=1473598 RepID=UPI003EC11AB2